VRSASREAVRRRAKDRCEYCHLRQIDAPFVSHQLEHVIPRQHAGDVSGNVKRWRTGDMRLRWIAAGLLAAEKQFRRVRGHKLLPKLIAALDSTANAGEAQAA